MPYSLLKERSTMIDCCPMAASIAPGAGSKDQRLFSYATNSSKQSKLNHKNIKEMEVQSGFRTYEAPRVLVKPFSLERGFATSAFGETGAAGATGKVLTIEGEEDF